MSSLSRKIYNEKTAYPITKTSCITVMGNSHCQKIEILLCVPEKSNRSFQKVIVFNLAHSIRFSIAPCKVSASTDTQIVSVADPDFSYDEFSKVETKKYY